MRLRLPSTRRRWKRSPKWINLKTPFMRLPVDGRKRIFSQTLLKRWRHTSAPVSFIEWRWSKDCRLKSIAHARSVYDIVLCVYERFRVDDWKRYVNDDRLRVDGDKNMRLRAFAFTIVFVWTGPTIDEDDSSCLITVVTYQSEVSFLFFPSRFT